MDIVLVHGSFHGAWCWELVRPELERRGHRVTTVDLPISDPALGGADYARVVEDAIGPGGEPVLVGHSMAGLVIPLVAAHRPVRRLVFLAAFLAKPGMSANDQRKSEPLDDPTPPATSEWIDLGDDVWLIGPNTASELFYSDVPRDQAAWALDRLRPQCYRVIREETPLTVWPDVASSSIVCREDRAINPDWVRTAARERLGVDAIELDGGHSPFLTRPAELADVLDSVA